MKRASLFTMLYCLVIGLAACSSASLPATNLAAALKYAPENTTEFAFTDWGELRTSLGGEQLSHASTKEELIDFFNNLMKTEAPASYFSTEIVFTQYQDWGWDFLDLQWEATVYVKDPLPAFALKFRDDMDFTSLKALLTQRGYVQETYQGMTLYSHPMDASAFQEWGVAPTLPLLNIAFMGQEKILLVSSNPDSVKALMDTAAGKANSLAQNPAAAEIVTRLGAVPSAYLVSGELVCVPIRPSGTQIMTPQDYQALWESVGIDPDVTPFLSYDMLGWGYRRQDGKATGWFIFHYPDAATASADLPARQKLAENGISFRMRQPYSESAFALQKITAEGNLLVLEASPYNDMPRRLVDLFWSRDLMFASCSK